MAKRKTRVDFNAPESLVERADAVADLLDTSRTSLLVDALRTRLDEIADDESFRRRLKEAYYADRVDFDTLESVVGSEQAMRAKLLRVALDREPPVPDREVDLPTAADFHDGELPEWTPDDEESDDEPSTLAE